MTKKLVLGFSTIFILLESILISYINYSAFIDLQIITSNSLISDNSVTVIFKGDHVPSEYELINRYPNITLLSEIYNYPDLQVWGLCGNYYLDSKINSLIRGTFFQRSDFFKNDFKAVLGKNVLNSGYCFEDRNGKKTFKFNNKHYEVIGTIYSNISNMLDNTAFINLDSFNTRLRKFVIDSSNSQSIVTTINSIKKEYNVDIVRENNSNFVERYVFNDDDKSILNILVAFFISILIIVLSVFTLRYYSEEIKVKRIIGICFKSILLNLLENIIFLTVVNTAFLATIYAIICYTFSQNIHLSFYFLPLIIFSLIILTTICLITYLYMFVTNNLFYKNGAK
jgi:hypothetical protein